MTTPDARDVYYGPFVVDCFGPSCETTQVMETGAAAPEGWLYIDQWFEREVASWGMFCSKACLEAWVNSGGCEEA